MLKQNPQLLVAFAILIVGAPISCNCGTPAAAEGEGEGGGAEGEGSEGEGAEGEGAEGEGAEGEGAEGEGGEGEGEGGAGCTVDSDCLAGQVCDTTATPHTCIALGCTNDAQCGTGQVCDTGTSTCVGAPCAVDGDCGTGKHCDLSSGTGVCVGDACTQDSDCGTTQVCFSNGVCGNSPLQDPYQAFCLGSGSVVGGAGVGSTNICSGQLAQDTFQFAICTCGDFNDSGSSNINVDSFNSTQGAYGGANSGGPDGSIGVDGATTMNGKPHLTGDFIAGGGGVSLAGANSNIDGDLYVFGDAHGGGTSVGRDAFISGSIDGFSVANNLFITDPNNNNTGVPAARVTTLAIPQVVPCPCDAGQLIDIAGIVTFGSTNNDNAVIADPNATPPIPALDPNTWASGSGPSTLTLPCGRFYLAGVNQGQSLTIHATARTVLFVQGDFIANSLSVQLDDGAEVDLFVTGDMVFNSSTAVGDTTHPSAVRTYVDGQLTSQASTTFGGLVYAPHADVTFSGHVEIFGAVFLHNLETGGSVDIHFDSAVRSEGQQCPVAGEGEGEGEGGAGEGEGEGAGEGEGEGAGGEGEGEGAGGEGEGEGAGGEGEGEGGGGTGCSQCDTANVCGNDACIVPSGSTTGTCGPCRTSLDCCFPQICTSTGTCIFAGG